MGVIKTCSHCYYQVPAGFMNNTSIVLPNGSRIHTKEFQKDYYQKNREKILKYNADREKEKYGLLKKRIIKNSVEFRKKAREYHKKWNEKNKEKIGIYRERRKKKAYSGMVDIILKRDNYECQVCGQKEFLNIHHFDGNRKNNSYWNLLTLCPACHRSHHNGLF